MKLQSIKHKLAVGLLGVAMMLTATGVAVHVTAPPSTFDKLIALAVAADAQFDLEATDWKPTTQLEADNLITAILYQFVEENFIGYPKYPAGGVTAQEYGSYRSTIAGTYNPDEDLVGLNVRFFTDEAWMQQNWMDVLVHELVHSQGFLNEAQTETLAQETIASMGNLGFPGMRKVLLDNIRRDALAAAYYLAIYGGTFQSQTSGVGGVFMTCLTCGDLYTPDAGQAAEWQAAREAVFTPEELRRSDARLRYWTTGARAFNYPWVLDAYVVRPMASTTEAACREGNLLGEKYLRSAAVAKVSVAVGPFRLDDFAYVLKELGWECG
jgi:hypothetical protein